MEVIYITRQLRLLVAGLYYSQIACSIGSGQYYGQQHCQIASSIVRYPAALAEVREGRLCLEVESLISDTDSQRQRQQTIGDIGPALAGQ